MQKPKSFVSPAAACLQFAKSWLSNILTHFLGGICVFKLCQLALGIALWGMD